MKTIKVDIKIKYIKNVQTRIILANAISYVEYDKGNDSFVIRINSHTDPIDYVYCYFDDAATAESEFNGLIEYISNDNDSSTYTINNVPKVIEL